eukprot:2404717-Alexandrium_andersonii.AAC.1
MHYVDPPGSTRVKSFSAAYGARLKVAALNVSSLLKPTFHRQIADYMGEKDIQLLALAETKSASTT